MDAGPSVNFKASVNVATQEFSEREDVWNGSWLQKNLKKSDGDLVLNPTKFTAFKCQKRPFMELEPYMSEVANNCYHLLEYLDDQSSDSRLETLIETYQKPVIIKTILVNSP